MTRHLRLTARNQYSWRLRNNIAQAKASINTLYLLNQNTLPSFSGLPRVWTYPCLASHCRNPEFHGQTYGHKKTFFALSFNFSIICRGSLSTDGYFIDNKNLFF